VPDPLSDISLELVEIFSSNLVVASSKIGYPGSINEFHLG
jgi:hypothetical protein